MICSLGLIFFFRHFYSVCCIFPYLLYFHLLSNNFYFFCFKYFSTFYLLVVWGIICCVHSLLSSVLSSFLKWFIFFCSLHWVLWPKCWGFRMAICVRTFSVFVLVYFEIEGCIFIFSVGFFGVFSLLSCCYSTYFLFLLISLTFDLDTFVLLIFMWNWFYKTFIMSCDSGYLF